MCPVVDWEHDPNVNFIWFPCELPRKLNLPGSHGQMVTDFFTLFSRTRCVSLSVCVHFFIFLCASPLPLSASVVPSLGVTGSLYQLERWDGSLVSSGTLCHLTSVSLDWWRPGTSDISVPLMSLKVHTHTFCSKLPWQSGDKELWLNGRGKTYALAATVCCTGRILTSTSQIYPQLLFKP